MFRKSPSLQLVVVIAAFLVIACNGSLPFASPFVQNETPVANEELDPAYTELAEERPECPIDKRIYTVLKEKKSGCYLISVKATPPPDQSITSVKATPTPRSITIYAATSRAVCYLPIFEQEHPDIRVKWCYDTTWKMTEKILSEKSKPQADVIWGLAATAMLRVQAEGMLEPCAPAGLEDVESGMRDTWHDPPHWVGTAAWMSAICVNTDKLAEEGLPMPTSWVDLIDPVYKGYLIMPNPKTSGTGFLLLSAFLQMFIEKDERAMDLLKWADEKGVEGEEAAWAYMDALHENVLLYTDSSLTPCKQAAAGKIPIGISYGAEAIRRRDEGHPIVAVFPEEGSGWEVETIALVRKPEIKEDAKTFVNWAISDSAMEAYARFFPLTSVQTDVPPPEGYVANPTEQLIKYNRFLWASANYDRITTEWLKRYEAKTESGAGIPSGFE
jgi:iron(III) transport system substrate-binding protein